MSLQVDADTEFGLESPLTVLGAAMSGRKISPTGWRYLNFPKPMIKELTSNYDKKRRMIWGLSLKQSS